MGTPLPIITAFGGINAAGRASFHHAFKRLIVDRLSDPETKTTTAAITALTGNGGMPSSATAAEQLRYACERTLIRRIDENFMDCDALPLNSSINGTQEHPLVLEIPRAKMPKVLPRGWQVVKDNNDSISSPTVKLQGNATTSCLLPDTSQSKVQAAGQLPTGFNPGSLYNERGHPRGLQMTVFAASDTLAALGIEWEELRNLVAPEQISVYAGSAMSQLDMAGNGGMLTARWQGKRVTSKQCPFGFAEMPADFINAYILGSLGTTGTAVGACSSFLYNLRMAAVDIVAGRSRIALVGCSEAPITAEIIAGYGAMGALATDSELAKLDGDDSIVNHRKACRPFAENCGFTLGESAQFVVLMDDSLALALGCHIHGAVADVAINADGYKGSISAPGAGNYLTLARTMASARSILGKNALQRSYVHAHGTGTPKNRVTESQVLSSCAAAFGIEDWPVAAVKAFVGHSIGSAGGDQLSAALGTWQYDMIPGIATMAEPAADVITDHLRFSQQHQVVDGQSIDCCFINTKGFGGNNATACIISPYKVKEMLNQRHGKNTLTTWQHTHEKVAQQAARYDQEACQGKFRIRYLTDQKNLQREDMNFRNDELYIDGYKQPINLTPPTPYPDMPPS